MQGLCSYAACTAVWPSPNTMHACSHLRQCMLSPTAQCMHALTYGTSPAAARPCRGAAQSSHCSAKRFPMEHPSHRPIAHPQHLHGMQGREPVALGVQLLQPRKHELRGGRAQAELEQGARVQDELRGGASAQAVLHRAHARGRRSKCSGSPTQSIR